MNLKENKNSLDVSYRQLKGIRCLISSSGIIDIENKATENAKRKILEIVSRSFENIPKEWYVEGEFKNNNFYVLHVINEKKEILDIDETIQWAGIFELCKPPLKKRFINRGIETFKNEEVRPEKKFTKMERIKEFNSDGKENRKNWRKKVNEIFNR